MNPQVCIIHGGTVFDSKQEYLDYLAAKEPVYERLLYSPDWKPWLAQQLSGTDVLMPSMPNTSCAEYDEWALWFRKIMPLLRPDAVLIGHSLGGIFLAKYLSEHTPSVPFAKLVLIAAPYADESTESLRGFMFDSAAPLARAATEIHLFASEDDPVVPYAEVERYRRDLPGATLHRFTSHGHFNQAEFPELLEVIRT